VQREIADFDLSSTFFHLASDEGPPFGHLGIRGAECRCDYASATKYISKLSGPLFDSPISRRRPTFTPSTFAEAIQYCGLERVDGRAA